MYVLHLYLQEAWSEGLKLSAAMNFKFPNMVPTSLQSIVTNASFDGVQLMADMLAWDPQKRPTAAQVINCNHHGMYTHVIILVHTLIL